MAEKTSATKVKKKRWVEILAPRYFQNQVLGESPVTEPNMLIGRTVTANLMTLTRDMKKQNINMTFRIDSIEGNRAYTSALRYEMLPASIRRLVRRNKDRIDESFVVKTQDGTTIRIKPFILTRTNTSHSLRAELHKRLKKILIETIATLNFETVIIDIVATKLQKFLYDELRRVAPLRTVEIRKLEIQKKGEEKVEEPQHAAKEERASVAEESKKEAGEEAEREAPEKKKEKPKKAKKKPKKKEASEEEPEEQAAEQEENE